MALLLAVLLPTVATSTDGSDAPDAPSAQEILERADRIRFPSESFQVDVRVTTTSPNREPEVREYRILSKGNDRTLLQTTAPPIDRGQILLMRDRDLWAFLPNLSQPIRLPFSQKLTGQVANGDLARANYVGDYNPRIMRTESVDGETYYVMELTAAERGVTYQLVHYWVHADSYRPYKAEFYTLSKRLLKTCYWENYQPLGGEPRPTRLVMIDAMRGGERSVLEYHDMRARELPDKVFAKDYLKKLSR